MTRKGVWDLQDVRDKYLQGLWDNSPEMYAWGTNSQGNLAQNDTIHRSSPTQIAGSWSYFGHSSSSSNSMHAIKSDATLWGWGRNNANGNLGLNDVITRSSPTQIPGTTWAKVCSSAYNAIGVKTNGTLWMWGSNVSGALGLNQPTSTKYSSPVQIPGTTWATGFAGREFTMAKKTDGTLWAWGSASYGNLAQNDKIFRSSPTQIPGTWNNIGVGWFGAIATKTNGELYSWGYGKHGNLGQNESSYKCYSSPNQIPGTTWNECDMNFYTAMATKTDGTLWSWGYNSGGSSGLLGQNQGQPSVASTSSPKQVPGGNWSKVAIGNHSCRALKSDGTLWTWGRAIYGSLGLGVTGGSGDPSYISSPTQIPGTTWTSVSSTYFGGFAGKSPLTPSQL